MNAAQIRDGLYATLPLVASIAVVVIALKIFKIANIPGSALEWLYLALACAAAKLAR